MHWEPSRNATVALALSLTFVAAAVSGCVVEIPLPVESAGTRPFELWITDAQAPLKSLELSVKKVFVGDEQLDVHKHKFDLLAHRGLADGFLLASGQVSSRDPGPVHIMFQGAVADLDGTVLNLSLPLDVLSFEPEDAGAAAGSAILLDINAQKSLRFDGAELTFVPYIDGAFAVDLAPAGPNPAPPAFQPEGAIAYKQSYLVSAPVDGAVREADARVAAASASAGETVADLERVIESVAPAAGIDPEALDPDADVKGWFVHFVDGLREHEKIVAVEAHGASLVFLFETIDVGYVFARDDQAWSMSRSQHITYVEADRPVEFLLQSSRAAIRLPQLLDPVLGLKDAAGNPFDGRGVGLAVVDIGIDGTHPDLRHRSLSALGPTALRVNYKVESLFTVDVPTTDDAGGHGTHVAGIAAGRGILDPTQKGVAPAAAVYAFGVGEADTTLWTNQALDWIVQNGNQVDPPIRVVTNSWTTLPAYDPNAAVVKLVNNLVAKGIVVVFSAGNRAGDGIRATTTGECQIPTAGVICVAAMDDFNLGTRDGAIAPYSSRGALAVPSTWPDITAPGSRIRSAAPVVGTTTLIALDGYSELQGTSMAAPHVAGVVALMIQAKPTLSPAQAESIVESTAYKFADGGAYAPGGSHNAKGHGLVDAHAAVALARSS